MGWVVDRSGEAVASIATMTWQIGWSLVLGFLLAAVVQSLVPKSVIVRLLPDHRPRTLATASALGAASSSCSYAALALSRSLFRKGADFTAAITFQIASTNLVLELGIILALLLGWQFTVAVALGGVVMIVLVAVGLRWLLTPELEREASEQADRAVAGSMEGHAAMDMSVGGDGPWWRRLGSRDGAVAVSHTFVMEWAAVLRDIAIGLVIAGCAQAWVPDSFWQSVLGGDGFWSQVWGTIVGPLVAIAAFVCSIGNVPLAAVLWSGGISFGGVSAFLFADLLIIPIVVIYLKYYGRRVTLRLVAVLYVAMVLAAYVVEIVFGALSLVPSTVRAAAVGDAGIRWNYTTWLDIAFGLLAVVLVVVFLRTGGRSMLTMMGGSPASS